MAAKEIKVQPSAATQQAQTVATAVAQAAKPGPVPVAGAGSPVDAAAAGVAAAVGKNVATSSAKLAPKSGQILARSTAAIDQMQAQEAENAQKVSAVPEGLQNQLPQSPPGNPAPTPPPIMPAGTPDPTHLPESAPDGVHGTGTHPMPEIRPPGALGPPSSGLFPGGTNWVEAVPGSGVWLPSNEAGKLWMPSYPGELAPWGYEEIAPGMWWPKPDAAGPFGQ
jgi:hypothetical protein